METQFAPSMLLYSFMHDIQLFNRNLVGGCVEAWARPFGRPSVYKIPADLFFAGFIHQDYLAVLPVGFPGDGFLAPIPQRVIVRNSTLQRDVGILGLARQFAVGINLVGALAVIDRV